MRVFFQALLVVGLFAGCRSSPFEVQPLVAPRIEGQVVDAANGRPLAGVRVYRQLPQAATPDQVLKGAEILNQPAPVLTGQDGRFVLVSEHNLLGFGGQWKRTVVTFWRPDYFSWRTNFTPANVTTNAAGGGSVIDAGEIRLRAR